MIGNNVKLSLLYRGTRDGFKKDDIERKCYDKGKTLIIIKSDTASLFGGYTPISWNNKGGSRKHDGSSFLFSVRDDDSIVKLDNNGDGSYEVHHSTGLPF